ncbi:hypothetical protein [Streptomyces zaomyceticus]|uniref:hypothetical protein n=1 Tax=Streptomyces zaomyceticus TaxID=68286 RepID=UPI0033A83F2C
MDTQTHQQTSTPAPAQGTHHWVMTLEVPNGSGKAMTTSNGTFTPAPGYTRANAFTDIYDGLIQRNPQLRGSNVVFFSIEPNAL